MTRKEQIVIDVDGTLTLDGDFLDFYHTTPEEAAKAFAKCRPNIPLVDKVNKLSNDYVICIWTARSDVFQDITIKWLKEYGVKYDFLHMGKPFGLYYVDDKFMSPEDFLAL